MALWREGNGNSKTTIDFVERPNYVLICPHDLTALPANIAVIINNAFLDWMQKHAGIRIREILPLIQDGQTIALHVWYDGPDVQGPREGEPR